MSDISGGASVDSDGAAGLKKINTIWNKSNRENLKRASQEMIKNRDKNDPLSDIESINFKRLM